MSMFKSDAHRLAGHAAAAKSKKTPPHLRAHQERLAMGKVRGNIPLQKTAPLGTPESSLAQPVVSTPMPKTKIRFYQKPVPRTVGTKAAAPKSPKGKGIPRPFAKNSNTHTSGNKPDWNAPTMPKGLAGTKKMAAVYGG